MIVSVHKWTIELANFALMIFRYKAL